MKSAILSVEEVQRQLLAKEQQWTVLASKVVEKGKELNHILPSGTLLGSSTKLGSSKRSEDEQLSEAK